MVRIRSTDTTGGTKCISLSEIKNMLSIAVSERSLQKLDCYRKNVHEIYNENESDMQKTCCVDKTNDSTKTKVLSRMLPDSKKKAKTKRSVEKSPCSIQDRTIRDKKEYLKNATNLDIVKIYAETSFIKDIAKFDPNVMIESGRMHISENINEYDCSIQKYDIDI